MDAEIKRQWPKSTAPQQETLPPAVGLVLLGVPALIGVLSKVLGG